MEPLVFKVRLTENDVVLISHYVGLCGLSRAVRWTVAIALAACAIGLFWLAFELKSDSFPINYLVIVAIVLIFGSFGIATAPIFIRWETRRQYRKRSGEYLETQVTLTPEKASIETEKSKADYQWDLFKTLIVTSEGLLFCFTQLQPVFWLPKRLFENNDLRDRVIEVATSAGMRFRNIM